ncbi:hypothetical protein [Actinacidiphila guanduensis]|jgi:hypothetical protein|uniref:DUF4034 domain-containing protein n=1 Tax=Actinacidiphila guanduensis TaxID=310781 RepID=A0A1G9ZB39_9ACTN|nr:hypothetical protein [Actinacidiphila guanduensis]SDN17826.1 hypothetical protein SAMN05216259_10362 [Actinacidiphila guanduensis]
MSALRWGGRGGKDGAEGRGDFTPSFDPAGADGELRIALEEVRIGRWVPMRNLLARTGDQWGLRTSRSQVLAAAAARSHVVKEWLAEEPASADALMMRSRVGTERVLRAHRSGHEDAAELAEQARAAVWDAARAAPADPVPWVCLLALAQVDSAQLLNEHRMPAPEDMLPPGPWRLLKEVQRRDALNREGHHRMLQFLLRARLAGPAQALNFAHWVSTWVEMESASPLLVLPMYAYAQHYRDKRERGRYDPIGRAQWTREPLTTDVERALRGWFERSRPADCSPLDLNHLAHALWAGRRYDEAARVFRAIGTHATAQPWQVVAADPNDPGSGMEEFIKARRQCLSVAGGSRDGP